MKKSNEPNLPRVVWLQGITCNGNTHSFLSSSSSRFEQFNNNFNLIYHPSLSTNISLDEILQSNDRIDYLLVEGAITNNEFYFSISNKKISDILNQLISKSKFIIAVGSCASYGGIHSRFEENDDIAGVKDYISSQNESLLSHEIINLTGCPVHPEWILQTLFTLKFNASIILDDKSRPIEIYGGLAHHGCTRNEYFEWKVEAKSFGLKEGCLFYNEGCRGPMTHSNCNKILWNDVSSKTRVGMPCIGCTEYDFPRLNMFETKKHIGIPLEPPLGISKRAYLSISGVAKTFTIPRLNQRLNQFHESKDK
ncbi:MAG: Ni/Fe hydrogenase [Arcobacter sp.]|uniref:NADH-quinone oxidoreductase subunit B family protein n=1 Tax=uncultured Arcobacter sp. TaxID=165434 RepID=UPI000CA8ADD7|nr:Ni/Fe hydrogenase [uncultured Arcobacter sp.]PLY08967.1 MAG: Ni/Fe hydrogenase [Arcobacter sp.]